MFLNQDCGICCFRPRWLQSCATIGVFVTVISFTGIASQSLTAYLATQITSLERQFGFTSSQTGLIVAANDVGFVLLALFMGYMAPKVHIPRVLFLSTIITAIAAFLCVVPYFLIREDLFSEQSTQLEGLPDLVTLDLHRRLHQISRDDNDTGSLFYVYSFNNQTSLHLYNVLKPSSSVTSPSTQTLTQLERILQTEYTRTENKSIQSYREDGVSTEVIGLTNQAFAIVASRSLHAKIPKEIQAEILLLAKWRLEQSSSMVVKDLEGSSSRIQLEELGSLQLMMVLLPYCSSVPKGQEDCEMFSRVLNKGVTNRFTSAAFWILTMAMFLTSVAKSPRNPMTLLYFDDNGTKRQTPMFVGIFLAAHLLGAILAFGIGVLASRLYVTNEDIDIHPENPHWIGAWWLGFVVIAAMNFLTSLPLSCFPRRLHKKEPSTQTSKNKKKVTGILGNTKEFCSSLRRCLTNPVLMGSILAGVFIFHMIAACLPFAAKYMESQFHLPAWKANTFVGLTWALPSLLGSLMMGYITSRVNMSPLRMLYLALISIGVTSVAVLVGMFIGCDTAKIVGYNEEFSTANISEGNSTLCSSACLCDSVGYSPVCGSNARNYFSPCHAGCLDYNDMEFINCQCIGVNGTASLGLCEDTCSMLPVYLVVMCITGFGLASTGLNLKMVTLRSVPDRDRALAVSIATFFNNLLGWLPAPIIFGRLVDSVCMIWTTSCAQIDQGACALYDINDFRTVQHSFWLTVTLMVFFTISFVIFKARNKTDWNSNSPLLNTTTIIENDENPYNDVRGYQTELLDLKSQQDVDNE